MTTSRIPRVYLRVEPVNDLTDDDLLGLFGDTHRPISITRAFALARSSGDEAAVVTILGKREHIENDVIEQFKNFEHEDADPAPDFDFLGFTCLASCQDSRVTEIVDFIAVPGLGGNAFATWQAPTKGPGGHWLRDFLPEDVPNARVWIYGYNSRLDQRHANMGGTYEFVKDLRQQLVELMERYEMKSIIMIGHSLGCILIKKAIVEDDRETRLLRQRLKGILFFGAPHRGYNIKALSEYAFTILQQENAETIVYEIGSDSAWLKDVHKVFKSRLDELPHIVSVYETLATPEVAKDPETGKWKKVGPKSKAVEINSAILDLDDSKESTIIAQADHSGIPKLTRGHNDIYHTILRRIKDKFGIATDPKPPSLSRSETIPSLSYRSSTFNTNAERTNTMQTGHSRSSTLDTQNIRSPSIDSLSSIHFATKDLENTRKKPSQSVSFAPFTSPKSLVSSPRPLTPRSPPRTDNSVASEASPSKPPKAAQKSISSIDDSVPQTHGLEDDIGALNVVGLGLQLSEPDAHTPVAANADKQVQDITSLPTTAEPESIAPVLPSIGFESGDEQRGYRFDPTSRQLSPDTNKIMVIRPMNKDPYQRRGYTEPLSFSTQVVSREHCEFSYTDGNWFVQDLGSAAGTWHNNMRMSLPKKESAVVPVRDGDIIRIGTEYKDKKDKVHQAVILRIVFPSEEENRLNSFNKVLASSPHEQDDAGRRRLYTDDGAGIQPAAPASRRSRTVDNDVAKPLASSRSRTVNSDVAQPPASSRSHTFTNDVAEPHTGRRNDKGRRIPNFVRQFL